MIIDSLDERPRTWRGTQNISDQFKINLMMRGRIARYVHELHREIDALRRAVGGLCGEDILFAKDRCLAVDHQARALVCVGDHAFTDDDALTGLELYLQRHGIVLAIRDG